MHQEIPDPMVKVILTFTEVEREPLEVLLSLFELRTACAELAQALKLSPNSLVQFGHHAIPANSIAMLSAEDEEGAPIRGLFPTQQPVTHPSQAPMDSYKPYVDQNSSSGWKVDWRYNDSTTGD